MDNARANIEYAEVDLERKRSLLKENLISQDQVDLAEKTYHGAEAQVRESEANLEYARSRTWKSISESY